MALRSAVLTVMEGAARKAARGLARDFGEVEQLQVSVKGPSDFVSSADRRAEDVLRKELQRARPSFGLLLEERGAEAGSDPSHRWIVDPLDGTTNFLHGIPHFAISIGLERDGEIIAGLILNPINDEMFYAERGQGAFLNHRRLRVSGRTRLDDAVLGTGIPHRGRGDHARFQAQLDAAMAAVAGIRRMGAASLDLAYVAAGRFEGFWESHLKPWDMAAGLLLVREAGGFACDFEGGQNILGRGEVIAANDRLHGPLLDLLRRAAPPE